jgi:hypothetical protein
MRPEISEKFTVRGTLPRAGIAFSILLLLAPLLLADNVSIGVSISPNDRLINATGDLAFPAVLPGYNYTGNITVRWAVPKDSLRGLQAEEVVVYVRASVPKESGITLEAESDSGTEVLTTLSCRVQGLNCGNGSVLARQIRVLAPASRSRNFSGEVSIEASLAPFERTGAAGTPTGLIDSLSDVDNTFADLLSQNGAQNASNESGSAADSGAGGSQGSAGSGQAAQPVFSLGDGIFPIAAGLVVIGVIVAGYLLSKKGE